MTSTMTPTMTILYVEAPRTSAAFYERLFDLAPVETSDTFALFALPGGLMLGLWSRHTVEPKAAATGGGCELAIRSASPPLVDELHSRWLALGISMLQAPEDLEFGRTFTAVDPDGHRIRVFTPPS